MTQTCLPSVVNACRGVSNNFDTSDSVYMIFPNDAWIISNVFFLRAGSKVRPYSATTSMTRNSPGKSWQNKWISSRIRSNGHPLRQPWKTETLFPDPAIRKSKNRIPRWSCSRTLTFCVRPTAEYSLNASIEFEPESWEPGMTKSPNLISGQDWTNVPIQSGCKLMGKSIAGIVGTQHENWQQLIPIDADGHRAQPSTRRRQYRDVKSMMMGFCSVVYVVYEVLCDDKTSFIFAVGSFFNVRIQFNSVHRSIVVQFQIFFTNNSNHVHQP